MPPKKKGKGNKLARMSEEEKLRYLQHRAAIEEEARRRKEHVIASYMKNKLKHEEAFTRLNTAKINQQWRQTLRQIKNKELHDASETLRQVFQVALKTKNTIINHLNKDWEDSSKQHGLAVQTHLVAVDKILDIRERRLSSLSDSFKRTTERNFDHARQDELRLETAYRNDEKIIKAIINCEKTCYQKNLQQLIDLGKKHEDNLLHQLMAEIKQTDIEGNKKIEDFKKLIKRTEVNYYQQLKPILDQYNELLTSDEKSAMYLSENEKVIKLYKRMIEKLKIDNNQTILDMREEVIVLRESVEKEKQVYLKMKKLLKDDSTQGNIRLKHLVRVSNKTLEELEELWQTVEEISRFAKAVNNMSSQKELVEQTIAKSNVEDCLDQEVPLVELSKFWERYGQLQVEVAELEGQYFDAVEEVSYLKQHLQASLNTIARPSTVPSSLYRDKVMLKAKSSQTINK